MRKIIKNTMLQIMIIAAAVTIVCGAVHIMKLQEQSEPDNPMTNQQIDYSHNLESDIAPLLLEDSVCQKHIPMELPQLAARTKENPQHTADTGKADSENAGGGTDTDLSSEDGGTQRGELQETDITYFTTSILDGETVGEAEYAFSIHHLNKKLLVRTQYVYVNGRLELQFDGNVTLKEGTNHIRITVNYEKEDGSRIQVYKIYKVYFEKGTADRPQEDDMVQPDDMTLSTDITDEMTVSEREFHFKASASDTAGADYKVTAVVNGRTVTTYENGSFQTYLDQKKNKIRLRVTLSSGQKAEWNYTVYYIPQTTEDTQPSLDVNVTDGMVSSSSGYTLDIKASDYQKNRIYYNKLKVALNGTNVNYRWATDIFTSYWLELEAGDNLLSIRAEDEAGRYIENLYHITYQPVDSHTPIGVIQVSVEAGTVGLGTLITTESMPIYADVPFSYCLVSLLEENGYSYTNAGNIEDGFYLKSIDKAGFAAGCSIPEDLRTQIDIDGLMWTDNNSPDSLGEYDFTQGSGWIVSQNGNTLGMGMDAVYPKDGDVIRIRYTLAYGKDVGGYVASGSVGGNINSNYGREW